LICLFFSPSGGRTQQAPAPQQGTPRGAQQGGMSSGIASGVSAAPVYDAQRRPITAGGFVDSGPVIFEDITKKAGLSGWTHKMGVPEKNFIVETNGSGVCLIDYDNDGWPDIYVGNYGKNRLYHNNRDGTFTDKAETAGVALGNWSPGSAWGDYDGDGLLDLYVTGYVHFDRDNLPIAGSKAVGYASCLYRGATVNCGPRGLPGEPDHLFHNNGDGTFTDTTAKAGVEDKEKYYGFSTIFVSLKGDGKPDLVVGNDSEPNYLYVNKGDGTFDDQSYISGFALNKDGREIASMGIAAGDYENNGLVDFYVTDFGDDYKVLYHNDGDTSFTDVSYRAGIAQTTIPFVGWGDGFIDYDNDGWLDLFETDGHVYPQVDQHDWGTTFAERPLLFHNVPNGPKERKFENVPPVKGSGLAVVIPGRGAAFGDLFNDGKIDVILNPVDGPPVLLRNVNPDHHHWVEMQLIGGINPANGKKSPRDATCATVFLKANGMRQRQDVLASGSYIGANDRRPHFGLGRATDAGTAEIHWPSGAKETVKLPAVDRIYTITEGKGITGAMCGGKTCPDANAANTAAARTPAAN